MTDYRVSFVTNLNIDVNITGAENEAEAVDEAWVLAQQYAQTLYGDAYVSADADLDGVDGEVSELP
jgi:hypothetical protein